MLYAIAGQTVDDSMPLSDRYTLKDLTITNTGLDNIPYPNSPEMKNLAWLAKTLEELEDTIGKFIIISAYRSKMVQDSITGANPDQSRPKSFHEAGMAVDIAPTDMTPEEFFGRLLASNWRQNLGEIALKPSQHTLHLSLPGKFVGRVLFMDSEKTYRQMTEEEIAQYQTPYVNESVEYPIDSLNLSSIDFTAGQEGVDATGELGDESSASDIELMIEKQNKFPWFLVGGVFILVAGGIALYVRGQRK
jgi:hypothetical protein